MFVLPNLLVMGSFFFAVATLTRRVLLAHVSVLAFFVAYMMAEQLIADIDSDTVAALLDPFGVSALRISTRYWTVAERNTELVPLGGALWLNRAVWLSLSAVCFVLMARRFSFTSRARRPPRGVERAPSMVGPRGASRTGTPLVRVKPGVGHRTTLAQLLRSLRTDLGLVLRGKAFITVMLFGTFMVYSAMLGEVDHLFGTPVLPVTYIMVRAVGMMLELFLMVVITFYAGELVHVERQARMHEIHDALPVPSWVPLVSKVVALWVAVLVLLGVGGLTGMGIQLAKGYTRFEVLLYVEALWGLSLSHWALVCVLAVVLQVAAGHEYLGFFLMLLYFISQEVMLALGFEHGLWRFAFSPEATYSDMNGYGHFMGAMLWYRLYWGLWAACLLVVASLSWVRGTETRPRLRLREARRRVTRQYVVLLGVLALGITGVGAFILYNTTVLNRHRTAEDLEDAAARYEEAYKPEWDGAPQPRVVAVDLEVDIFPEERELALRGYEMDAPILGFYAFLSADYEVARDRWNDVAIEVYHHAPHDVNVPRMIEAVKASLDYFTSNFSPYQYRQVRIAEFPRYLDLAVSHPNTIPYSESVGFIADLREEDRIDYVFYVTAHEVAHQWWGHQVVAGEVQGCTVLAETLAQYSALMVMEKEYGRAKMKRLLAYELDHYLRGRGTELEREVPLALVQDHPYIHYNKGAS